MTDQQQFPDLLTQAVVETTGIIEAKPRASQAQLSEWIENAFERNSGVHLAAQAPTGTGKALDVDTPIPTPTGWKKMGDLVAGDQVYDENGEVCNVVVAHEVQYDRTCYELTFDDGSTIVADAEHLWPSQTRALRAQLNEYRRHAKRYPGSVQRLGRLHKLQEIQHRLAGQEVLVTAGQAEQQLAHCVTGTAIRKARQSIGIKTVARGEKFNLTPVIDSLVESRQQTTFYARETPAYETLTTQQMYETLNAGGAANHAISVTKPLQMPDADLPLDPYFLGVWLGDGSARSSHITNGDPEVIDELRDAGFIVEKLSGDHHYGVHLATGKANNRWQDSVTKRLRHLNLLQNKHIPQQYLRASFSQRLDLFQGIMDTDGYIDERGSFEMGLSDEQLIADVSELMHSLGIKHRVTESTSSYVKNGQRVQVGLRWRIAFVTDLPVFRLPRKAARATGVVRPSVKRRFVTDIRAVETRPVRCIGVDSASHLFLAGMTMTPTHNSLSYLAPAFRAAAEKGQRTLISTEGLALQRQIIAKDAPAVAAATKAVYGVEPTIAVLKGFSNYVCAEAATETAQRIFRRAKETSKADMFTRLANVKNTLGASAVMRVSGVNSTVGTLVDLVTWALMHANDPHNGQRDECPVPMDREWQLVSVPSGRCKNSEDPANACAGHLARAEAAAAHIVVTNHTLMAIQATKNIPVLIDSKTLGVFDHIVIDEAHALPSVVRSNGAVEISGPRISRLISRIAESDDPDAQASPMTKTVAQKVADLVPHLDQAIDDFLDGTKVEQEVWIEQDDEFAELDAMRAMFQQLKAAVTDDGMLTPDVRQRHVAEIETMVDDIDMVSADMKDAARWAIKQRNQYGAVIPKIEASPIDVSSNLYHRLWTRQEELDLDEAEAELQDAIDMLHDDIIDDLDREDAVEQVADHSQDLEALRAQKQQNRVRLTVVAVSATLSDDFPHDTGLHCNVRDVDTPFAEAYEQSALYIPEALDEDLDEIAVSGWGGKLRMDTQAHHEWAKEHMLELLYANGGAAMVICATAASAKAYAQAIEDDPDMDFKVFTQWDRRGRAQAIDDWIADTSSVIVGTRSLMTGVDAKGVTNTLVIIDRPARAPMNPVDKARCTALIDAGVNRFAADTRIYVQDAAVLLEQAAGRLIRCFDLGTEILTTDGWKSYKQIKVGDTVYGVPPQLLKARGTRAATTNGAPTIEQHQVKAIKINDEPEPLLRFTNRVSDIVATPDHTMLVQPQKIKPIKTRADGSTEYYVSKAPDYVKTRFDSLPHRFQLPLAGRVSRAPSKLPRDWFTLLGLVITDGHISKSKNSIVLTQSTAKQAVVDEIDELLSRIDIKFKRYVQQRSGTTMSVHGGKEYTRNGDIVRWVINGHDSSRIRDLLVLGQRRRKSKVKSFRSVQYSSYRNVWNWLDAEKVIPRWIINTASRPNLLALLRGLMLGDGTYRWCQDGKSGSFYTGTKLNADRFQEICALVGYRSNVMNRSATQWEVRFAARGSVNTTRKDILDHGIGRTWCVNTELGSVVARRNGRTFIAGNSADDRGMVAVLDPRLRAKTPISYNAGTRKMYMNAVDQYGYDFGHLDDALDWLEEQAQLRADQAQPVVLVSE